MSTLPTTRDILTTQIGSDRAAAALAAYHAAGPLTDAEVAEYGTFGSLKRTKALDARYAADAYPAATVDFTIRNARRIARTRARDALTPLAAAGDR